VDVKNFNLFCFQLTGNLYQLRVTSSSISYLMFQLWFLFKSRIHFNLQSHFQGLFSNSMTGIRCTKGRSSVSKVSRPQSFIERRCNRGSTMPSFEKASWTNRLQPISDNVSRLVRFSRSFSASDVKFGMWFSRSSRSCGR